MSSTTESNHRSIFVRVNDFCTACILHVVNSEPPDVLGMEMVWKKITKKAVLMTTKIYYEKYSKNILDEF